MPDKLDLLVNGRPLSELKVVELKDELGKRGLSKIGNKTTLCDRMKGVLVEEAAAKAKSEQETRPTASPRKEDVVPPAANPIVAEYLAVQQAALEEARKNAAAVRKSVSSDDGASSASERQTLSPRESFVIKDDENPKISACDVERPEKSEEDNQCHRDASEKSSSIEDHPTVDDSEAAVCKNAESDEGEETRLTLTTHEKSEERRTPESSTRMPKTSGESTERRASESDADVAIEGGNASDSLNVPKNGEIRSKSPVKEDFSVSTENDIRKSVKQNEKEAIEVSTEQKYGDAHERDSERVESEMDVEKNDSELGEQKESCEDKGEGESTVTKSTSADKESRTEESVKMERKCRPERHDDEDTRHKKLDKKECEKNEKRGDGKRKIGNLESTDAKHGDEPRTDAVFSENAEKKKDGERKDDKKRHHHSSSAHSHYEKESNKADRHNEYKHRKTHEAFHESVPHRRASTSHANDLRSRKERRHSQSEKAEESLETFKPDEVASSTKLPRDSNDASITDVKASSKSGREESRDVKDEEELDYEEPIETAVNENDNSAKETAELAIHHNEEKKNSKEDQTFKNNSPHHHRHHGSAPRSVLDQREERVTEDGFVRERSVSPARYPVSQIIIIRQLTRPFTTKALKELLSKFGKIVDNGFWIDQIKSSCMVKYSCVEEAVIARGRLHNIVWPTCSPKTLKVDYSDEKYFERHMNGESTVAKSETPSGHLSQSSASVNTAALVVSVNVEKERRHIHSAALDEEKNRGDRGRERENDNIREKNTRREGESKDRGKDSKQRHSVSSPSRTRDERKRDRRISSGFRDEPAHKRDRTLSNDFQSKVAAEPEKRVKTADELFLKTKSTPAIYYLPLSDEQIAERAKRLEAAVQKPTTSASDKERTSPAPSKNTARSSHSSKKPSESNRPSKSSRHSRSRSPIISGRRSPVSRRRSSSSRSPDKRRRR